MTTTYEPGTVAVATVRGVPNVRVFLDGARHAPWSSAVKVEGTTVHGEDDVTDIRPLVVLDVADAPHGPKEHYVGWLRSVADDEQAARPGHGNGRPALLRWIADQIEAQTKPPRIPEPGLYGVVEAKLHGITGKFVRMVTGVSGEHWSDEESRWADWSNLVDPVLVRDGIEDGAR